jgi:cytochrome c oxidase cbb3-type subunit 4
MLKDVVSWLDYSVFDEIALVIFAACFLAIVIWALSLRRESTNRYGAIPLTDDVVDPRPDPRPNRKLNASIDRSPNG